MYRWASNQMFNCSESTKMQQIWIPGRAIGKARPRFSKKGVYTEQRYGRWKKFAIKTIKSLKLEPAPKPCFIECYFINFFSSDADNLTGGIIDSMTEAQILHDDSSSYVVGCSGRFVKQRKRRNEPKPVGVLVRIYPANLQWFEDVQSVKIEREIA